MTATTSPVTPVTIRPAHPEEAGLLGDLAVRSKSHWGYDADFLEACRDDLALTPDDVASSTVYVFERDGEIAGYYRFMPVDANAVDLDALFVDPVAIGQGVGRRLWDHAVATARDLGYSELIIQSDPYAEGFYMAMGAVRSGELESTVTPGRMLPLLRFVLPDAGQHRDQG
jgi:GNAT superfamily N-acetyltransferase